MVCHLVVQSGHTSFAPSISRFKETNSLQNPPPRELGPGEYSDGSQRGSGGCPGASLHTGPVHVEDERDGAFAGDYAASAFQPRRGGHAHVLHC